MKRAILILLLFSSIFSSIAAIAQITTVSGTITDPNGLPYAYALLTATLNINGTPMLSALPYSPPTQPTGLSSSGSFTIGLADNTLLSPGGSHWNFLVCSSQGTVALAFGKGPVCFTVLNVTISGASQSLTSTLTAAAVALTANFGSNSLSGSGTTGTIALWTGSTSLGNSQLTSTTNASIAGGGYLNDAYSLWIPQIEYSGNAFALGAAACPLAICAPFQISNKFDNVTGYLSGTNQNAGLIINEGWSGSGTNGGVEVDGLLVNAGTNAASSGTGTIGAQKGIQLQTGSSLAVALTVSNDYSVYVASPKIGTGGTLTNHYGFYMEDQTGQGLGTNSNPFGIYVAGGGIYHAAVLFAVLPTCNAAHEGGWFAVSNSTTNTWGATITGGGANHVVAYCDGTNWTVAAK